MGKFSLGALVGIWFTVIVSFAVGEWRWKREKPQVPWPPEEAPPPRLRPHLRVVK